MHRKPISQRPSVSKVAHILPPVKCGMCDVTATPGEVLVKCVSCPLYAHPNCLEMTDEMAAHVTTYPWQCIECKRCCVCNMGDREDAMIFCDKCDRGFHTYCIGLEEAPQGSWICDQYCNPNATTSNGTPEIKASVVAV